MEAEDGEAAVTLDALADDALQQIVAACGNGNDMPLFEAVKGLACLSNALLQQLHRLRPLVGIRSLAVVQRPAHGPWRVALLYRGKLTAAVVEQARQGRVSSIFACRSSWPELDLDGVQLNGTWAATFGEAAVCSAALRNVRLEGCRLQGPLPKLKLPALQELHMYNNQLTGGLEPLRGCTALQQLDLGDNELTGGLEPLRGCTALQALFLQNNQLVPTDEDKSQFQKQCRPFSV